MAKRDCRAPAEYEACTMTGFLRQVLTNRMTGPIALVAAVIMAALLAVSWTAWQAERTMLEGRIAQLTQQSERSQSLWRAQLAACHAASGGDRVTEATYEPPTDPKDAARRLLTQQPEGIDVCARMESADQAVLSTLK